jgi:hypothetical protein
VKHHFCYSSSATVDWPRLSASSSSELASVGRLNYCWSSPAQAFLLSVSLRSMTKTFILSKTCTCFDRGLLFDEGVGLCRRYVCCFKTILNSLLCNYREISNYTTAVTRQRPVNSNRGTVFSVLPVPRSYKQNKLGMSESVNHLVI